MKKLIVLLTSLLFASSSFAADITLEFDHSPIGTVASYNIYEGGSVLATASVSDVIPESGYYHMVVIRDLRYDVQLSFQISAVFDDGSEGELSNVIVGMIPRPEPEPEVAPTLNRVIINDGGRVFTLSS